MDEYLAIIKWFAGNFAPRGSVFCQGQILSISQNTALFSLLGVTYGGNGQTTFALPNFQGRIPVGAGQYPGLSSYQLGQAGGSENVTLNLTNLPLHNHAAVATTSLNAVSETATLQAPLNNSIAASRAVTVSSFRESGTVVQLNSNTATSTANVSSIGTSTPVPIRQPCLALNFIIVLEGYYPSRN